LWWFFSGLEEVGVLERLCLYVWIEMIPGVDSGNLVLDEEFCALGMK